jgi:hypothetical protein
MKAMKSEIPALKLCYSKPNGPFVFVRRTAGLLVQIRAILGFWNACIFIFYIYKDNGLIG